MPDARRKRGQRATIRRRLAVVGIAAFLLVDLALVAVALTRNPTGLAADRAPSPAPSVAAGETTAPTASTPSPAATPEAPTAVPPTRLLSAVDGGTAWRAEAGTCVPNSAASSPSIETTTTGGAAWSSTTLSTDAAIAGVDRLQATDAATVFVVGPAGATCAPAFAQTFSGGAEFRDYPDRLQAAWYVSRADPATVHSPSGDRPAPCPIIDLAVTSDSSAGVLCNNGMLYRTLDGATSWDAGVVVDGAVALTASRGAYLVAIVDAADCEGVAIAALDDAALSPTRLGCAPVASSTPGSVVVSAGAGSLWVWAGDGIVVSADGGRTW